MAGSRPLGEAASRSVETSRNRGALRTYPVYGAPMLGRTIDLSRFIITPIDAPGLNLAHYHVCEQLTSYVLGVVRPIEASDYVVGKITIRPEYIRAEWPAEAADRDDAEILPDFVEKALPEGLYARLVAISEGPFMAFPKPPIGAHAQAILDALGKLSFSPEAPPGRLVLNGSDIAHLRQTFPQFQVTTFAADLRRGLYGWFWHKDDVNVGGDPACENPRVRELWANRSVPAGQVWIQPPEHPDWLRPSSGWTIGECLPLG